MQTIYLHTQFGVMIPNFRIDGDDNKTIIINNHNIIQLGSLLAEYEENNQKLLDLHYESFEIEIYEGVHPKVIVYIHNQRFEGTVSLREMTIEYNIYA